MASKSTVSFPQHWNKVVCPNMNESRKGFAAIAVGENRIVVAGGHSDATREDLRSAEMLVVSGETRYSSSGRQKMVSTWKKLPKMKQPRYGCMAVSVGMRVIVVGGMNSQQGISNTGEILILHGDETEWQLLPCPMKDKRVFCAAINLNNKIYVMGGSSKGIDSLASMESYDLQSRTWTRLPPMSTGRIAPAAAYVGGMIYVAGGFRNGQELDSVECFDIDRGIWRDLPKETLPNPIAEAAIAVLPNSTQMVMVGGTSGGKPSDIIYNHEFSNNDPVEWASDIPTMPTPRSGHALVVLQPHIFILGGHDGKSSCPTVETFTYEVTVSDPKLESRPPSPRPQSPERPPPIPKRPGRFSFTRPLPGKLKVGGGHQNVQNQQVVANTFYEDALAEDEAGSPNSSSINRRLQLLIGALNNHFQYKVFYTMVSYYFCLGELKEKERNQLVKRALEACSKLCNTDFNYALFRIHLDKALQDNAITTIVKYELEGAVNREHIKNADFIKQMQNLLAQNTEQIQRLNSEVRDIHGSLRKLEANITRVNESVSNIATGLRRKYRVEACVGIVGALLNAISFGIAGSVAQGCLSLALSEIVDFCDVPHLCDVTQGLDDISFHDALQTGLDIVEGNSEAGLMQAVQERNSFVIISAVAAVVSHASGKPSEFRFDSYLDPVEEKSLPIHAAINNNHSMCFMAAVAATNADFNRVDSKGRTPADFAAVHGRVDMMNMIVDRGGRFNLRSEPAMRKYAEKMVLEEQKKKWRREFGKLQKQKSPNNPRDQCSIM